MLSDSKATQTVAKLNGRTSCLQVLAVVGLGVCANTSSAQPVDWGVSAGGVFADLGNAIAVDDAGNSYVTGSFEGTAFFGPIEVTSGGSTDVFVAKYDVDGAPLWVRSGGGGFADVGSGVAIDAAGNCYVTGYYEATASFGTSMITSNGGKEMFLAKYDTMGNHIWVQSAGGPDNDLGTAVTVDSAGNNFVAGQFAGTATFDSLMISSEGFFDVFVAKYDGSGTAQWVEPGGGPSEDLSTGVGLDSVGNIYMTGSYEGTARFGAFTLDGAGSRDVYVVKLNGSGTPEWARSAGGATIDLGADIAVDGNGSSFVAGSFAGMATFEHVTLTAAGATDVFLVRYDDAGNLQWTRSAGGTSGDAGTAVALDVFGNCYVSGRFGSTATFGSLNVSSEGGGDIFLATYDGAGNVLAVQSAGGTAEDTAHAIALDAVNNAYMTGSFEGMASFDSIDLNSAGASDAFVARFAATIVPAVSSWSLLVMVLGVFTGATAILRHAKTCKEPIPIMTPSRRL